MTRSRLAMFLAFALSISSVSACLFSNNDEPAPPDMAPTAGEVCDSPADDDSDGLINCADPECNLQSCSADEPAAVCNLASLNCVGGERGEQCMDSLDNDRDGKPDCMDPDCESVCACADGSCRELCGDNIDNDQDGTVNEGCPCILRNSSNGLCGIAIIGVDGTCIPPAGLQVEETLCDNLDNDCDGVVDEGCPCIFMNRNFGVCLSARFDDRNQCQAPESFRPTEVATMGNLEVCDGLDNDCDGAVDEMGCEGSVCVFMNRPNGVCNNGVTSEEGCEPPRAYQPTEVDCDGADNDCDGVVDEGCSCIFEGRTQGVCRVARLDPTTSLCRIPPLFESEEDACDGADNDCDGAVDEGCPEPCLYDGIEVGVCTAGIVSGDGCAAPVTHREVEADSALCDGLDNDCDGVVDEGCACSFKSIATGICNTGVLDDAGECAEPDDYQDTESSCGDGVDNDCDGAFDCLDSDCAASVDCTL